MTHGALAGMLLRDLILTGTSPWREVYEPSRKPASGVVNFVKENVTAIQNFAEYLMPAEIGSLDELKPGQGGIMRNGTQEGCGLARHGRQAQSCLRGMHSSWLPRALELDRAVLGLPLPWIAFRGGW